LKITTSVDLVYYYNIIIIKGGRAMTQAQRDIIRKLKNDPYRMFLRFWSLCTIRQRGSLWPLTPRAFWITW